MNVWAITITIIYISIQTFTANEAQALKKRVVCYYTNWSPYRPGLGQFSISDIDPFLCTHLIYSFGTFTDNYTLTVSDSNQDIDKFGYKNFNELKNKNNELKTLLALGGWNEGSRRFSQMVSDPKTRQIFIKNAITFLREHQFDGLDMDWQYPAARMGSKPEDKENYAKFVQEFKEELNIENEKNGKPMLLLTVGMPAGLKFRENGFDVPKLNKYLDWMNILSYDYHDSYESIVNHHSPLYALDTDDDKNFNVDATVKYYLKAGADPGKLVIGIPTYGRSFTLLNTEINEIGVPASGPGKKGEFTGENGYLAYYEICTNILSNEWQVVQTNPNITGPYAYKDDQWIGYDDMMMVKRKSAYVNDMGLGGIMFWTLDQDDFKGTCHGINFPLIRAGSEDIINTDILDTTDEAIITKMSVENPDEIETPAPRRISKENQPSRQFREETAIINPDKNTILNIMLNTANPKFNFTLSFINAR